MLCTNINSGFSVTKLQISIHTGSRSDWQTLLDQMHRLGLVREPFSVIRYIQTFFFMLKHFYAAVGYIVCHLFS